jgi:uncharacterized membrane protein YfcA
MLSYGLEKENLVGTKAINSFIMQLTKLISYGTFGALSMPILHHGIMLGLGATTGVFLARKHLINIDVLEFKRYTLLIMFISGVFMLYKAF